jgi:L-threonylcarbamoyladenylate synthase
LYGLGADAFNPEAVDRVFEIKGRPADKPLPVLISHLDQLDLLVKRLPAVASAIMSRFWPGRLTIVLEARSSLPANLTAGTGCIGVRLAGHPVAVALVQAAGLPITATSANLSKQVGASRVDQLSKQLLSRLDLVLDAGPLKGGVGSTIVDISREVPVVLREGEISKVEILAAIRSFA